MFLPIAVGSASWRCPPHSILLNRQCKTLPYLKGRIKVQENSEANRQRAQTSRILARKQTQSHVESIPATPPITSTPNSGGFNWFTSLTLLFLGALVLGLISKYNRHLFTKEPQWFSAIKKWIAERLNFSTDTEEEDDETLYRRAVARTRQAIYVHRAIGFMNTNAPARVMVELDRALKENDVCRSELVAASHSQEDLQKLYRVHLRNAEVPPDYATLLQMREMLGISAEHATKIENELFKTDSFVI